MKWNDGKPYNSLNLYYRSLFGEKAYKIALDIGCTCPNRDGTLSTAGCIYCSNEGSGDFAIASKPSIEEQIDEGIRLISDKYKGHSYIAYLQSYSNTYGPTPPLIKRYKEILADPRIKGLAIGTRPDCISDEMMDELEALSKEHPIWIELGLQTVHTKSADFINRCYPLSVFDKTLLALTKRHLKVVVHLIAGLPGETEEDFLESVSYIANAGIHGIKLHMLQVLKGTPLANYYTQHPFTLMSMDCYCDLIVKAICLLPKEIIVHRITGDPPKSLLIEPKWTLNKRLVLNTIHQKFKGYGVWQGFDRTHN